MKLRVRHRTEFTYAHPVSHSFNEVRLKPLSTNGQVCETFNLRILPGARLSHYLDFYLNCVHFFEILEAHTRLSVESTAGITTTARHLPYDAASAPLGLLECAQPDRCYDFLQSSTFVSVSPEIWRLAVDACQGQTDVWQSALAIMRFIHAGFRYVPFSTDVNTHMLEVLEQRRGVCQDFAHVMLGMCRAMKIPARYVSGYLYNGAGGTLSGTQASHAWCEVYLPGAGWVGLDPTSGLMADEGHIPLAATPDPQGAAPVSGLVEDCKCDFEYDMRVTRIYESARVTKPYTEQQWAEIEQLGHKVDEALRRNDCRLTMGGEPTFVSVDDTEGAEWNTLALGPRKRLLADDLLNRLQRRYSKGALLHHGQGKWYPGESLPRWSFACYWRKDGHPIWENQALFADQAKNYGFAEKQAEEFIQALSLRLGCGNEWIQPAYEDAFYYLWKERRLPTNVDPLKSKLKNEEDRVRLGKIFEQGLDKVTGYILPLQRQWAPAGPFWFSGQWFLRSERCYLIPGDSPMGLRLPLDSLPWVKAGDYPYAHEQDPLEERAPLPPRPEKNPQKYFPAQWLEGRGAQGNRMANKGQQIRRQRLPLQPLPPESGRAPARGESASWIIRSALCLEPRQGKLHVFMPPARTLEDYLDCVAAVEDTAELLEVPVMIEGYAPPFDPRLNVLKVTPDPGVIEVNMHPTSSWDEMVRQTEGLYEEARLARLGTEKFMLDGRHTGTGGGNHIVLGGPSPEDSPLLRRPDLLRSLVTYWQNHPSLSFLFSGLFIGPTSQSPRVDEARNDSLYELEVAFRELDRQSGVTAKRELAEAPFHDGAGSREERHRFIPPWLVDRIFRNLLVDATGNTHRSEFCIDKLYAPESSSGRLGLLELRAFEMPPHARMSLAQQLLLRGLVARFWEKPYANHLVRWGTDIHDRWMLPHFVWSDFGEVLEDLSANGYPMKAEWFLPHFEFRFPQIGDLETKNIRLELRQALEPWHVLGEEAAAGGAVRYVDSSVERLEVKLRGLVDRRHVITVGGTAVPLHPTGANGEYVAGVRYRAWQPPNCLHPTIGIHAPLVFDIVDTWNGRSIGGCTYHVAHPGGLSYSTLPVNAYEAESRRLGRFFRIGHTPGPVQPRHISSSPYFPFTLDLRRT